MGTLRRLRTGLGRSSWNPALNHPLGFHCEPRGQLVVVFNISLCGSMFIFSFVTGFSVQITCFSHDPPPSPSIDPPTPPLTTVFPPATSMCHCCSHVTTGTHTEFHSSRFLFFGSWRTHQTTGTRKSLFLIRTRTDERNREFLLLGTNI